MAIVFVNADSGEEYITVDGNEGDRKNLTSWHAGDELILAVAAQNEHTIVVVNRCGAVRLSPGACLYITQYSVGPLIVESWIDHPNVSRLSQNSRCVPYTLAQGHRCTLGRTGRQRSW